MALYHGVVYGGDVYSGQRRLNAFEYELGLWQGRLRPDNSTVEDGEFVFCIGSDRVPAPVHDIAIGDVALLEQQVDLTGIDFVRFTCRLRQPDAMADATAIPGAGVVFHDVFNYSDPALPVGDTLLAVVSSTNIFESIDVHRGIRVAGSSVPGNNGVKRITGVYTPRIAIVDSGVVATDNPLGGGGGTATLLGARWRASVRVAGVERVAYTEVANHEQRRVDLAAHVSKLAGLQTVQFRLELVEV